VKKKFRGAWVLLLVLALMVAVGGCGGGGGESSSDAPAIGDDEGGSSNTPAIKVDSVFLSDLTFGKDVAFEDEVPFEAVVRVLVDQSDGQYGSLKLYETDEKGENATQVAMLYDDGKIENGDDILGDSVYSGKVNLMEPMKTIGQYHYRVFVDEEITKGSSMVSFEVIKRIELSEYKTTIQQTSSVLSDVILDFNGVIDDVEFAQRKKDIVDAFNKDSSVKAARQNDEGTGITVEYESGIILNVAPVPDGQFRGLTSSREQDSVQFLQSPKIVFNDNSRRASSSLFTSALEAELKSIVPMQTITALSPYYDELNANGGDDFDGAFDILKKSSTPQFVIKAELKNKEVLPSHFKNLNESGIVIITSHGDVIDGIPVIILNVGLSDVGVLEEWDDINKDIQTGLIKLRLSGKGEYNLCITPAYISKYNKGQGNSIVSLGICSGLANENFAKAFLNSGFAAVIGYDSRISNAFAFNSAKKIFEGMVSGKSLEEAFATAKAETFNTASVKTEASSSSPFIVEVNVNGKNIFLVSMDSLKNGNFENNFDYWSWKGDVRILKSFANITLSDGGNMLILGTGIANGTQLTDSMVWQSFTMPNDAEYLDFAYDFASEEPMEFIDQGYNDTFETTLSGGGKELKWTIDVDSSEWYPLKGDIFPLGDSTAFHTGIGGISPLFVIPPEMRGKVVTLKFHVWDVGDSYWDSAAIIGDIRVWKKYEIITPAPESNNDSPNLKPCSFIFNMELYNKPTSDWPWPYNLEYINYQSPGVYATPNKYISTKDGKPHVNCVFFARARALEANGLSEFKYEWISSGPKGAGKEIRANSIANFDGLHQLFIESLERSEGGEVTTVYFREANWDYEDDGEQKHKTWSEFTSRPGGGNITYYYY
jgi:hypothetical protein